MDIQQKKILKFFHFRRILIPVILGLGVATFLLVRGFDREAFQAVNWTSSSYFYIFLSVLLMAVRDVAYMYRLRILTDGQISWRHSFDVIMLWEFASAVTPSIIGGSAIALYIVNREGVSMGRTTAIVMVTAFLDELFYILMVPTIIILVGTQSLFSTGGDYVLMNTRFGTQGIFFLGYLFILVLTTVIIYGVFFNPRGFKWILLHLFRIPFLRKWRTRAAETGNEIIITSSEMKGKPFSFWFKAFAGTFFSWTARFWVVNTLILAFVAVDNHLLIYGRQLVMWVILLISPTPGGSGVAEFVFSGFLGEFIPQGLTPALGLLWRTVSYYPYLFIGAIILPQWLKRVYAPKKEKEQPRGEPENIKPV
ncbi:MAG: lysylphosphatidylglycerol synthase transmembrane domain-containing protein [Bacteroidales bacterium]